MILNSPHGHSASLYDREKAEVNQRADRVELANALQWSQVAQAAQARGAHGQTHQLSETSRNNSLYQKLTSRA